MANTAQRSFSSGELSASMYARTDLQRYAQGVKTARNVTVQRTGGLQSRAGTEYLGTTKSSGVARLIDAVLDTDQAYVLELGNLYVRFWLDGALVTGGSPAAWLTATPYALGDLVTNGGTSYVCISAHTSGAATEPGVGVDTALRWYALTTNILELPTPFTTAMLDRVQYVITPDAIRFAHPDVQYRKLIRSTATNWYFEDVESDPPLATPTGLARSPATLGTNVGWTVTAFDSVDGVESLAASVVEDNVVPSIGSPITVSWNAVTGATSYRVYKSLSGSVYGFVAEVTALSYEDVGADSIDFTNLPPTTREDFTVSGRYPGVIGAYQQRVLLGGSVDRPDVVLASRSAQPDNFTASDPLTDDSALEWRQVGRRINRVRHFAEVARTLWQFSDHGESIIQGAEDSLLVPGAVNPRLFSENGSALYPEPLVVNDSALYVQARGGIVRDLFPIEASGFGGSDLTLMSAHLVDGYTIEDWCYEQTPNSIIWAVRSDGVLLSLTYVRELGVLGWTRHDTDGFFESVACVPETTRDSVYAVVRRTINGNTVRYVERMFNRQAATPVCVDAGRSVQTGLNQGNTLTLSNGTTEIGSPNYYVLVASDDFTGTLNIGDVINIRYEGVTYAFTCRNAGTRTFERDTASSPDAAPLMADIIFPDEVTIAVGDWQTAYSFSGLSHLEGEAVSIYSGEVIASPNNTAYTTRTVASGAITGVTAFGPTLHIGLPFTCDIQTLDVDAVTSTIKDRGQMVAGVYVWTEDTWPFWAGPRPVTSLTSVADLERIIPVDEDGNAVTDFSGVVKGTLLSTWNNTGRVFLRQVDPVPMTILAISPQGHFGGR